MTLALITEALAYRGIDVVVALAPVAGLALAAVFVVAAVTKLADRDGTTEEFANLGLPAPGLLARVVPPAELIVAALLLTRPNVGALTATVALLAFSAVLLAVLRSGRSVSCGCLGSLSDKPVSAATLVRNGALITLAALASTGPNPAGLALALPAVEVALAAGTAALLGLVGHQVLALRNQIGRLWSVELAGEAPTRGGRRSHRQANNQHALRATRNGVTS